MIYRAFIQEVISAHSARVRIPFIHGVSSSHQFTPDAELPIATVCTLPGLTIHLTLGEVVIVSFENNDFNKPIILGILSRSVSESTTSDALLSTIEIKNAALLPSKTQIGDVNELEVSYLKGLTNNIQFQINALTTKISEINKIIESLSDSPKN